MTSHRTHRRLGRAALLALALQGAVANAAPASAAFATGENAFTYAAEYRDPTWGGTYLRARWYHPGIPAFTSRDALQPALNRYGYGGGDPLMHVDPSGHSYRRFAGGLEHVLGDVNAGGSGHFARLFLSPLLGPLQILADPRGFWRSLSHDTGGTAVFLALGVGVEAAGALAEYYRAFDSIRLFRARAVAELGVGAAASAVGAFSGGFRHFHGATLLRDLESTFGADAVYRLGAGIGYQPFALREADVDTLLQRWSTGAQRDDALVFRARQPRPGSRFGWTSPWQEQLMLGRYHETLIAVTRDAVHLTSVGELGVETMSWAARPGFRFGSVVRHVDALRGARFAFAGMVRDFDDTAFSENPLELPLARDARHGRGDADTDWRGGLINHSQWHSALIRRELGQR